jgi:hypothetical protein
MVFSYVNMMGVSRREVMDLPLPLIFLKKKLKKNIHQILIPEIKIIFKCGAICISIQRQLQGDL